MFRPQTVPNQNIGSYLEKKIIPFFSLDNKKIKPTRLNEEKEAMDVIGRAEMACHCSYNGIHVCLCNAADNKKYYQRKRKLCKVNNWIQ